ncbi:MAG TPA: AlpA family phage regulatory protein [Acidocella sp.]|jgi:prophage regulatory protein|uniref:helix-turn-helix transcriptional regulator n=1 Tax=Acidocella sp. TaxID=50710 RepID=UPI002C41283B|nr:AlpA family phage regulatory protein [Acidocella sp.]HVE22494.1 AlpA family phage regulatory protein [Acidocella sp.]
MSQVVTARSSQLHQLELLVSHVTKIILRRPEVTARYGLPTSTLYDWMAKGLFPKPIQLGPRSVGWCVEDLERWEIERMQASAVAAAAINAKKEITTF